MSEYVVNDDYGLLCKWKPEPQRIVRCADCKHYHPHPRLPRGICPSRFDSVTPDGFCSWGEARKHGGTTGAASGSELVR